MNKKKLTALILATLVYALSCISSQHAFGDDNQVEFKLIAAGMKMPEFVLHAPDTVEDQRYLGLKDMSSFSIVNISAKIIIMEAFSFYCPHCRNQAPGLNKLYNFIREDEKLSNEVKILGLSIGTDKDKTDLWKSSMHVPFPLFRDTDTSIWKKLGRPGLPCLIILSKSGEVLAVHFGVIDDMEGFFSKIKEFHKNQNTQ